MATVREIYEYIDSIIPFSTEESWDNSGFLAGDPDAEVTHILTALDITVGVINEAVSEKAELIVSHHPLIFTPLKAVMKTSPAGRLISENICAICTHTPSDTSPVGMK